MNISFHNYRNSDYIRLFTEILLICKAFTAEVLQAISIAAYYNDMQAREPSLGLALGKNRKNPYTTPLADADQQRDDALDAFKYFLLYCSKQPDPAIRAAAGRLIVVLQTFGWSMQLDSYSEQSKNVRSFIAEVEARADLQVDLATCSCTTQFELLKSTQTAFEQLMNDFNIHETNLKTIDPAAEKEWLRQTMTNMIDDLDYHCRKQTNAECLQIRNQLETVVESIASEIKARNTRAETDDEAESDLSS